MDDLVLLQDKTVYLVFECVWLEDGIYPEYKFSSAFFNKEEAESFLEKLQQEKNEYNYLHKIIEHIITKNKYSKPLFWNEKYDAWTDEGAFMSVSINQIIKNLS